MIFFFLSLSLRAHNYFRSQNFVRNRYLHSCSGFGVDSIFGMRRCERGEGAFFLHIALNCKHSTPGSRISNNHQLCFCWLTCDNLCGKFKSRPKQWGTKKKRENNWTTRAEECVVWKNKMPRRCNRKRKINGKNDDGIIIEQVHFFSRHRIHHFGTHFSPFFIYLVNHIRICTMATIDKIQPFEYFNKIENFPWNYCRRKMMINFPNRIKWKRQQLYQI